jgi:hypothetical protein
MKISGNRLGGLARGYVANLFLDLSEPIIAEGAITLYQSQPLTLA